MTNIKQVAVLCGVSPSTVSNVFTNRKNVSKETRELVMKISQQLNYIPSVMASSMITKQTNFIGYFFDAESSNYSSVDSELIKGCIISASKIGKQLIIYYNINSQQKLRSSLRVGCQPIDGAVLILPQFHDFRLDELSSSTIPHVIIGSTGLGDSLLSSVDVDNYKISYEITNQLISMGHKRIAMFNYQPDYTVTKYRMEGYTQALTDNGLDVIPALVSYIGLKDEDGEKAAKDLFNTKQFFSAVIVAMPEVATGVYKVIQQNGLTVGDDISVISFVTDKSGLTPQLASANVDYEKLGSLAIETLNNLMENPQNAPYTLYDDATITFDDSCRVFSEKLYAKFCLL